MIRNTRVVGEYEGVMVGYKDKDRREVYILKEIKRDISIEGRNEESKREVLRGLIYLLSKKGKVEVLDSNYSGYYDMYEGYKNIEIRRGEGEIEGLNYVIIPREEGLTKEIRGVKIGIDLKEGEKWEFNYKEVGRGEVRGRSIYHYNKTRWEIKQGLLSGEY